MSRQTYKIPGRKTKAPGAMTETQYKRLKSDMHKIIEDGMDDRGFWDKLEKQQQKESIRAMFGALAIPLVVLRDEFGFGKDRAKRFIDRVIWQYKCVAGEPGKHYVSIEDIVDIAKDELGIDVIELANKEL